MSAVEGKELYRFYHMGDEETLALRGVSLQVNEGEMVAIMGPSGSGKSTLLACMAGLDEPDGGFVEIMGRRISRRPESERAGIRARYIGILLQNGNLFDHLTLAENIKLQMRRARLSDPAREYKLLECVGLSHRGNSYPWQLSGGEAARAGLAVALSVDPPVLLADEPTGEVDAETETVILELLKERCGQGRVVIVATHSDAVAAASTRIIRLEEGRVIV